MRGDGCGSRPVKNEWEFPFPVAVPSGDCKIQAMRTYDGKAAKDRMNLLAEKGRNFIFVIDYRGDEAFVEPLEEIDPAECLFNFRGIGNTGDSAGSDGRPIEWCMTPPAPDAYARSFAFVRHALLVGNSYLVNLTCRIPVKANLSMRELFLRAVAPYRLWMRGRLVCFSPECFIRLRHGEISSYPMKGTMDAMQPDAARLLMNNEKEAAEHATIVDLIRNDLSMVADHVTVRKYRYIDCLHTNTGHILQTSSEIVGKVLPQFSRRIGDLVFSQLPAGSITGAPKKKTCEIIAAAEGCPRGFYTGVMGCWCEGVLDSAVMIRFIDTEGGRLYFRAGGGITARSREVDEYHEVIQKVYVPIC